MNVSGFRTLHDVVVPSLHVISLVLSCLDDNKSFSSLCLTCLSVWCSW